MNTARKFYILIPGASGPLFAWEIPSIGSTKFIGKLVKVYVFTRATGEERIQCEELRTNYSIHMFRMCGSTMHTHAGKVRQTNLISTSLNVVSIALTFWASFNRWAMRWRILVIFTCSEIPSIHCKGPALNHYSINTLTCYKLRLGQILKIGLKYSFRNKQQIFEYTVADEIQYWPTAMCKRTLLYKNCSWWVIWYAKCRMFIMVRFKEFTRTGQNVLHQELLKEDK